MSYRDPENEDERAEIKRKLDEAVAGEKAQLHEQPTVTLFIGSKEDKIVISQSIYEALGVPPNVMDKPETSAQVLMLVGQQLLDSIKRDPSMVEVAAFPFRGTADATNNWRN